MSYIDFIYHIVCGTDQRQPFIDPVWEKRLHGYLGGIVNKYKGIPIEINGIEDHVHMLARMRQTVAFDSFIRELKSESSKFVRREITGEFAWQRRYAAFTVSESAVPIVRDYIRNQKAHHQKQSYEEEYKALLRKHNIDFDERNLWD